MSNSSDDHGSITLDDILNFGNGTSGPPPETCLQWDDTLAQVMLVMPLVVLFLTGLTRKLKASWVNVFTFGMFVFVINDLWVEHVANRNIFTHDFLREWAPYIPYVAVVLLMLIAAQRLGALALIGVGVFGWHLFGDVAMPYNVILTGALAVGVTVLVQFETVYLTVRFLIYVTLLSFSWTLTFWAYIMAQTSGASSPECELKKRNRLLVCDPGCPVVTLEVSQVSRGEMVVGVLIPLMAALIGIWVLFWYEHTKKPPATAYARVVELAQTPPPQNVPRGNVRTFRA